MNQKLRCSNYNMITV